MRRAASLGAQLLRHVQGATGPAATSCDVGCSAAATWAPIICHADAFPSSTSRRSIHTSTASCFAAGEDYYSILGLSKDSSDQDIKKGYYNLAKKFHPDTNKENPEAAKKFQEVQKAYETLRDPEKRRMYDQVGREGMDRMDQGGGGEGPPRGGFGGGGFPFGGFNPDIFEQIFEQNPAFAQFFGRVSVAPIRITFEEAVQGTSKRIQLGGGGGRGGIASQRIDINIPPGVDTGDQVEVQVDMPGKKGSKMRVAIPIEVEPHALFTREGSDINVRCDVPLHSALLGTSLRVPTLDGHVELAVPACSQHGDKLRLRGKGIYDVRRGVKGDQYVELRIAMPKKLTTKQRELISQFGMEEVGKGEPKPKV